MTNGDPQLSELLSRAADELMRCAEAAGKDIAPSMKRRNPDPATIEALEYVAGRFRDLSRLVSEGTVTRVRVVELLDEAARRGCRISHETQSRLLNTLP